MLHFKLSKITQTPAGRENALKIFKKNLEPLMRKAIHSKQILEIDIDNTAGIAHSFLDELFGNLIRQFGAVVFDRISIVSCEETYLIPEIKKSMLEWYENGIHENSPLNK